MEFLAKVVYLKNIPNIFKVIHKAPEKQYLKAPESVD